MPVGPNTTLIRTASTYNTAVENGFNGTSDIIDANLAEPVAVIFDNGNVGDEVIENFGKNDSILNYRAIFDGNKDGIINFGSNGILDIDRTSSKNAGFDQITVQGLGGAEITALRYLGAKDGGVGVNGYHVYADASVRLAGFTELTVANDTFDAGADAVTLFYDTALGLNLGGDTISNFGADDRIVTTTMIFNGDLGGEDLYPAENGVFDLPGKIDGYNNQNKGGQIDLVGVEYIVLLDQQNVNGVNYYYYGVDAISA